MSPDQRLWVFGYGSLVWRPDIPYDQASDCRIIGWKRRFWQASTDHRGVPSAPGRVATLIPDAESSVVGRAYRVPPSAHAAVLRRLDHRERGGYSREHVSIFPLDRPEPFAEALMYRATPCNPNWVGPEPLEAIARIVSTATGPSGPNLEYVRRLQDALRAVGVHDPHIDAILAHVHATSSPMN